MNMSHCLAQTNCDFQLFESVCANFTLCKITSECHQLNLKKKNCGLCMDKLLGLIFQQVDELLFWPMLSEICVCADQVYKCCHPGCNYVCAFKEGLKQHMGRHDNEKPFTCDVCGKSLKTAK